MLLVLLIHNTFPLESSMLLEVVYIQPIGNFMDNYTSLFNESFFNIVLLHVVPPIKPKKWLTKKERESFSLSSDIEEILYGSLLGDLYGRCEKGTARFAFIQGLVHKDYIFHLYEIFQEYCPSAPKFNECKPHPKTGKMYTNISFNTYTLPCFNEIYDLFYESGKKIVPKTIGDLLTPLSLAYWIADDGSWNKVCKYVVLCTDSFALYEVELLIEVLNKKFNLKCYKIKSGPNYRIIIPSYSIPALQSLLAAHIPPMMKHKIGL